MSRAAGHSRARRRVLTPVRVGGSVVERAAYAILRAATRDRADDPPLRRAFGVLHSVCVPDVSAADSLHRLLHIGLERGSKEDLAEPVLLYALLLVDRLMEAHHGFRLSARNAHRVLLATILLSAKLLDDECCTNAHWARVGGVDVPHLNKLEAEVASLLDYRLFVDAPTLDAARARLISIGV